ncbi:hypothetical protein CEXT_698801 [Caerostris extrusa]|uniref:Uncharacterized protein n=1 Tax=Caerostris extrusa TaxID=172846 RepID=A0AAV4PU92_CAEEX|nr:hypothetical protein CEXT_698801 [Caerostris extrusa]
MRGRERNVIKFCKVKPPPLSASHPHTASRSSDLQELLGITDTLDNQSGIPGTIEQQACWELEPRGRASHCFSLCPIFGNNWLSFYRLAADVHTPHFHAL